MVKKKDLVVIPFVIAFFLLSDMWCIFKLTIGIPCPGCGMTRAVLAILRLDFEGAFHFHPISFFLPLIALIAFYQPKNINLKKIFNILIIIFLGIIITLYIYRMIKLFPSGVPMDYYQNNILNKIISLFK